MVVRVWWGYAVCGDVKVGVGVCSVCGDVKVGVGVCCVSSGCSVLCSGVWRWECVLCKCSVRGCVCGGKDTNCVECACVSVFMSVLEYVCVSLCVFECTCIGSTGC